MPDAKTGRRIHTILMIAGALSLGGLGLAACGQTKEISGGDVCTLLAVPDRFAGQNFEFDGYIVASRAYVGYMAGSPLCPNVCLPLNDPSRIVSVVSEADPVFLQEFLLQMQRGKFHIWARARIGIRVPLYREKRERSALIRTIENYQVVTDYESEVLPCG